jgi:hypothetical protein
MKETYQQISSPHATAPMDGDPRSKNHLHRTKTRYSTPWFRQPKLPGRTRGKQIQSCAIPERQLRVEPAPLRPRRESRRGVPRSRDQMVGARREGLTGDAVMIYKPWLGSPPAETLNLGERRRRRRRGGARVEEAKREMREASWRRVFFLFASPFLYLFRLSFCGFTVVPLEYIYMAVRNSSAPARCLWHMDPASRVTHGWLTWHVGAPCRVK